MYAHNSNSNLFDNIKRKNKKVTCESYLQRIICILSVNNCIIFKFAVCFSHETKYNTYLIQGLI